MLEWFLLGYLAGSIPFGYIISRCIGIDITRAGSGNIGAANVYRALGLIPAVVVAVLDLSKGFIPVMLAPDIANAFVAGTGAVLGAIFSIFLAFRGGKGFAALTGAYVSLLLRTDTLYIFPILLIAWFTTFILTKITSLSNLVTVAINVPLSLLTHSYIIFLFSIVSFVLIFFSHRENIKRLIEGREATIFTKAREGVKW